MAFAFLCNNSPDRRSRQESSQSVVLNKNYVGKTHTRSPAEVPISISLPVPMHSLLIVAALALLQKLACRPTSMQRQTGMKVKIFIRARSTVVTLTTAGLNDTEVQRRHRRHSRVKIARFTRPSRDCLTAAGVYYPSTTVRYGGPHADNCLTLPCSSPSARCDVKFPP